MCRSVPIGCKTVEIVYPVHCLQCPHCGDLRQEKIPFADPHQHHTRRFERYVLDLCRYMSMKDVADHLQVHWDVVKTNQKRYLKRHFSHPPLQHFQQMAIDEIAVDKGHRYVTVVLDLESSAEVFVGDGKGVEAFNPFRKRLQSARAKIRTVAMDISPVYIDAVHTHRLDARIVFDHFLLMNSTSIA